MIITRIALTNFLSYNQAEVNFLGGLNIITGKNAVGKTNLMDSIFLGSVGRSSRHSKDKDLINFNKTTGENAPSAKVTINLTKKFYKHSINVHVDKANKKRILIDDLPVLKVGELMGFLSVVFFSPREIRLLTDGPNERRRFLDIGISQQNKVYYYALSRYNKLLQQRNRLLKTYQNSSSLKNMLEIINASMAKEGATIIKNRVQFVSDMQPIAAKEHYKLSSKIEELKLNYETESVELENLEESLLKAYKKSFDTDIKLQHTTVGPHRDDVKISANGLDLRKYGSQGQLRSAILSLKLAEARLFSEKTGETPILILDDVLSELDFCRRQMLFESLDGYQTFITCTEATGINVKFSEYRVEDGNIRKL